jgi:hypothetical protein
MKETVETQMKITTFRTSDSRCGKHSTHFKPLENDLKCFIQIIYPQNEIGNYRKSSNHSFFGTKQNIMKILMYSIYAFDKPFIENATHGKLELHIQIKL